MSKTRFDRKSIFYTSQQRSMYVGRIGRIVKPPIVASSLLVSIEGDMELLDASNNRIVRSKSFLIPANMNVTIDTHGSKVAQCFLDELGDDFSKLVPQMTAVSNIDSGFCLYSDIRKENEVIDHASFILNARPSNEVVFEQFEEWIGLGANVTHDDRVAKAVTIIKDTYTENISVGEMAASVGLSVPRLSQLFKQVTGVPIRRFRLWYRIFATAAKLSKGYSLTDAAIASGFSDYPQLCRVFKEFTGLKPSVVKNNVEVRVLAGCF